MNEIMIETILLASSGFFSVGSITFTILLLLSEKGLKNGLGYAMGNLIGYTSIGIIFVMVRFHMTAESTSQSNKITHYFLLFAGLFLIFVGMRNYWTLPIPGEGENRFFKLVDKITPFKAFGFGLVITIINFKNLALYLAPISVIAGSNLDLLTKCLMIPLIAIIFCSSAMLPVLLYILFPKRGKDILLQFKTFLNEKSRPISIIIPIGFGSILLIRGAMTLIW